MISNKLNKQLATAAAFVALTFAPAITRAQDNSQQQQPPAQTQTQTTPQQQTRRHGLMQNLNLTDDQKAQFKKIHGTTKSQMESIKNDSSLTADQKQAKIHELRHDARMQMAKLLTPDQRAQMKANARELRAARREKQQQPTPQAQPQG